MTSSTDEKKIRELRSRICKGRLWLLGHENSAHYKEGLDLYESLVDEAKKYGIEETSCWEATPDEAEEIFLGPKPKQEGLIA